MEGEGEEEVGDFRQFKVSLLPPPSPKLQSAESDSVNIGAESRNIHRRLNFARLQHMFVCYVTCALRCLQIRDGYAWK